MTLKLICKIDCETELRVLSVLLSPKKGITFSISQKIKTEEGIANKSLAAVHLDANSMFELNNHLLKCLTQVVSTTLQSQSLNKLCYPATVSDLKYWKETSPRRRKNGADRAHLSYFLQNMVETLSDEELINLIESLYRHLPDDNVYRSILGKQLNTSYDKISENYLIKKNQIDESNNVVNINKLLPIGDIT